MKRAILVLITIVISLTICELVIRALGLAPEIFYVQKGRYQLAENPLIGYEPIPYFEAASDNSMFDYAGKANSLGFRDREHEVAKPAGVYRILVLGDSITQGLGIADPEDLYTAVLEKKLLEQGLPIEVLNFGVNGYNTQQEVETLRDKGLQYTPDLVVVAYCVNDSYLDSGGIFNDLQRENLQLDSAPKLPRILAKSALCRLNWAVVNNARVAGETPEAIPTRISENIVPDYFEILGQLAAEHDFVVLVVAFPQLHYLDTIPDPGVLDTIAPLCRAQGFHTFDLFPSLAAGTATGNVAVDNLHPNEWGSKCAGEAIADHLQTVIMATNNR